TMNHYQTCTLTVNVIDSSSNPVGAAQVIVDQGSVPVYLDQNTTNGAGWVNVTLPRGTAFRVWAGKAGLTAYASPNPDCNTASNSVTVQLPPPSGGGPGPPPPTM